MYSWKTVFKLSFAVIVIAWILSHIPEILFGTGGD
jgi:hypothetical protein